MISILIPCFNSQTHLKQCIESALIQNVEKEIILLDDGSTDNTLSIAKEYPIKIHRRKHKGFTETYNELFNLAKGDWIQYLDSDDYLAMDKLEKQRPYLSTSDVLIGTTYVLESHEIFKKIPNNNLLAELKVGIKYQTNCFLFSKQILNKLIERNKILWKDILINHDTNLILDLIEINSLFVLTPESIAYYRYNWSDKQLTNIYKDHDINTKERITHISDNFNFHSTGA
ncbi:MAG: glycosyltransferase family 2 protein [Nostoc sp. NMS7]|nr:glycosyltransferase family 2 protein [Nostoc sp. NMS7]